MAGHAAAGAFAVERACVRGACVRTRTAFVATEWPGHVPDCYERQMDEEIISRKLDEIEALESVYQDDGALTFSEQERECLREAKLLLEGLVNSTSQARSGYNNTPLGDISGSIKLPGVQLFGQAVNLHFQLPPRYPAVACRLRLDCAGPRVTHVLTPLRDVLDSVASELNTFAETVQGDESLLVCADHATSLLESEVTRGRLGAAAASGDGHQLQATEQLRQEVDLKLKHTVIWFHHIRSSKKRKSIAAWSHELQVGGFAKIGYPGVMLLEGSANDVDEFVARLRSQQWKAMAVRGEEEASPGNSGGLEGARRFGRRVVELGEKELGVLGEHCRVAGLESLFLAALKIDKG